MRWRWLLPLLPVLLGLSLAATLNRSGGPNPLYLVRINFSSFVVLLGVLGSVLLLTALVVWQLAERKHLQVETGLQAEATEDRRRFLQRLDHELKNPLMAMRAGLANFANAPSSAARKSALASVEAQTVRLSRLTADLRKIAELENRPLDRSPVNLEQLLNEVLDLTREKPGATDRHLRLILPQAPWPLPTVSGDWDLIFLALYNLLDNALKFSRAGDTIEVRGREDRGFVVIETADTGPGIRASDLPHVWEELYRGEGGRTVPGSGLGLALVRAVVERHGGNVSLASKAGQGTVVTVQLPIEAANAF